jgi:hypothetical protein
MSNPYREHSDQYRWVGRAVLHQFHECVVSMHTEKSSQAGISSHWKLLPMTGITADNYGVGLIPFPHSAVNVTALF